MGYETTPEELAARRTESVRVPLNVAQLVSEAARRARGGARVDVDDAVADLADSWAEGQEATDEEVAEWEAAETIMRRRYGEAYEVYGQQLAQRCSTPPTPFPV